VEIIMLFSRKQEIAPFISRSLVNRGCSERYVEELQYVVVKGSRERLIDK